MEIKKENKKENIKENKKIEVTSFIISKKNFNEYENNFFIVDTIYGKRMHVNTGVDSSFLLGLNWVFQDKEDIRFNINMTKESDTYLESIKEDGKFNTVKLSSKELVEKMKKLYKLAPKRSKTDYLTEALNNSGY